MKILRKGGVMLGYIFCSIRSKKFKYISGFLRVAIFSLCSLATAAGGEIVVWGESGASQAAEQAGNDFIAVSAGMYHSLALREDLSVVTWDDSVAAVSLTSLEKGYIAISALGEHSLALKADGTIEGWGVDLYGEAGRPSGNDFIAVSAGMYHSLALKADGSIIAWGFSNWWFEFVGDPYFGEWGDINVPDGNDFVAIAAGFLHSLALKADGSIIAWGNNKYGQLDVPDGNDFIAIAAGANHNLALRGDGTIAAWGFDEYGQVTETPKDGGYIAIACGAYHSLALKADGSVVAWGDNRYGQTELPEDNIGFVDIAGGSSFSMAVKGKEQATIPVIIDIKPGEFPNRVNPKAMGVLPAAILGSADFDITDIDPTSVTLNRARIRAVGKKPVLQAWFVDVNGDGYDDLLCNFDMQEMYLDPGETAAVLEGSTYDGIPITGEDAVSVLAYKQR